MANRKNTFLIKRSNVAGKVPAAGDLLLGELAINTADGILYASGTTANSILPIGWDRVSKTGDTMTGGLFTPYLSATTISATSINKVDYIVFNTGTTSAATQAGTIYFDNTEKALSYNTSINQGVTVNLGQQNYIRVFNNTGIDIPRGKALELLSSFSGLPSVSLAINRQNGSNIIGISSELIPNGKEGIAITYGIISNIELTGMTVGSLIYASDKNPGGLVDESKYLLFPLTARTNQIGYVIQTGTTTGKLFVAINNENTVLSLTDLERNVLEGNTLSTGTFEYTGMVKTSSTTFNIAPLKGWIVENTYGNSLQPNVISIEYSGVTGQTTPYLLTDVATYVLINSASTLTLQNSFPTPQQRRQNIFLGRVAHPDKTTIVTVNNTVDYDVSPMSSLRDLWTPIKLINENVVVSPNGANLNFNTSSGTLWGNGIGWAENQLNPNSLSITGSTPTTFQYRVQTGGTYSDTTTVDPAYYDLNGVRTVVGGGANSSTNQRIYLYPNRQYRIQYGQKVYSSLTDAIVGLQTESFVTFVNNRDNAILIGILSVNKNATSLNNTSEAVFTFVSKFGELLGGTGGVSTTTLQQAYNNSSNPEIIINSTLDGLTIKNGTGNADNVTRLIEGMDTAGSVTSFINADGHISGTTLQTSGFIANSNGVTASTISATTYFNLPKDVFTTGGTYSNITGSATFTNNTGGTFTVTGFTTGGGSVFTGGTVTGPTNFIDGLTANTISATTYYGLPTDITITGGTYSNGVSTFRNNTGGTFTVTGYNTGTTVGNGANTYLARWTGSTGLSNSIIRDNGTDVGVNIIPQTGSKFYIYAYTGSTFGLNVLNQNINSSYGIYSTTNSGQNSQTAIYGYAQGSSSGNNVGVFGLAQDGLLGIGIKGVVDVSEFGSMTTGIGGYFDGMGAGYSFPTNSYSVQLIDGTEGINKVLVSKTSDGKANWSSILSGLTSVNTGTISATTYFNLPTDVRVTGGTYSNGITTFTNNTGGTFSVTGYYTGATDVFTTGGTYTNNTFTYTNNTGGTFNVLFNTVTGLTSSGAINSNSISATTYFNLPTDTFQNVYTASTIPLIVTNNTQNGLGIKNGGISNGDAMLYIQDNTNTVNIELRADGTINAKNYLNLPKDVFITGGTYNGITGNLSLTNNTGNTFSISGFSVNGGGSVFTGGTVTGPTYFTNGLTANTISATTYYGLPTDVFTTGGTYNAGSAIFTNNTGGTFTVTGFGTSSTDTFTTGGTYSNGITIFTNNTGGTFNVTSTTTYAAGVISGATYSSAGSGQINLPAIKVALYNNSNNIEPILIYDIASGTTGTGGIPALVDNDTNYVVVEYNGGSPRYYVYDNDGVVDDSSTVLFMVAYRAGTFVHTLEFGNQGAGLANKLNDRFIMTDRFGYESGLALSLSASTGIVMATSGVAWNGPNRQSLTAVNSSGSTFFKNYHSGGTWTYTITGKTVNNTFYDNGTDAVSATAGKYLVNWYFRGQEVNSHLYEVYGTSQYDSVALAQLSVAPALPELITSHAILLGRIIILVGASTGVTESAFGTVFQSTQVTSHNDLTGLQGGTAGQYYHINANQYNNLALTNTNNNFSVGQTVNGTLSASTFTITSTPVNSNNNAQILSRNSTTGDIEYIDVSVLTGATAPSNFNYGLANAMINFNFLT